ncbi:GspH/FimT family pseudopilin [Xanthomonas campestris pv. nigromaculans]|nr:GspH/FimT family pseudopilin [Xanthomonas campestris pv. nigromaculans]
MEKLLHQSGISLLEVVTTTAVLAMLASIAWPSFTDLRQTQHVRATIFELTATLAMARSTSISRGTPVALCPSSPVQGCIESNNWTGGWLVYSDPDGNRSPDSGDDVISTATLKPSSQLQIRTTSGRKQVRYGPLGRALGSNLTFHICSQGLLRGEVVVNTAGRPRSRLLEKSEACPN